ncbi:hypothetical protein LCGC14_0725760 [marine sediment metagenome]|uniref:Uncharacterized protein n=1 Tax=marine sediment metagenome TaxID=412755 RepID=A0A0F9QB24_9ZZZZ|nr:hypothetical protein [Pricia sp.]
MDYVKVLTSAGLSHKRAQSIADNMPNAIKIEEDRIKRHKARKNIKKKLNKESKSVDITEIDNTYK